jgi:hypothetical protein
VDFAEYVLLIINLSLGLGFGLPLARRFARLQGKKPRLIVVFSLLILVYFIEAAAFAASMSTDVLSIILAFVWGVILAIWLRRIRLEKQNVLKLVFLFSLYSSLPAASFLCIPGVTAVSGWAVTSVHDGIRFGIPEFVPWPANTILGFCVVVATIAVVFKVVITMGTVRLLNKSRTRKIVLSGNGS